MAIAEKEIFINPYISSCVYNFKQSDSRAYIVNEKSKNEFMFEGISSDLWNILILSSQNEEVSSSAPKNPPPTPKMILFLPAV